MITRPATSADIERLHQMHMASIKDICSSHYDDGAIQAWSGRPLNKEIRQNAIAEDVVNVLEIDGHIQGFYHVKPSTGSIEAVFVSKKIAGQGFGKTLLQEAMNILQNSGCQVLTLESTLNAFGFYEKHGFQRSSKNGQMRIGDWAIEYVPMSRPVAQQGNAPDACGSADF
jgi:putative acetyltransferase